MFTSVRFNSSTHSVVTSIVALVVASLVSACVADEAGDSSDHDAQAPHIRPPTDGASDNSIVDAGAFDTATADASVADAGPIGDAGSSDSGSAPDGGAGSLQLLGRFDRSDPAGARFGWSGSAIVTRFQGTGLQIRLEGSPNQFALVLDGTAPALLKTTGATSPYLVATNLPFAEHEIVIWRRTEGSQGENTIVGATVQGGQLLPPPPLPARRIEIYGDSITAGYGIEGQGPDCPFSQDTENHYLTYGAVAARALGAELHTVAWSGIGMYRNYNVAGASPDAMPSKFARTLPNVDLSPWDFSWQPDAVVINLGTNDASTNGDPGTPYRDAYLGFVRTLRNKYSNTHFVLAIGPMLSGSALTAIKGHIQAVIQTRATEGDTRLSFLEFPVHSQADGLGCDWHPNVSTNAKMANLLVAELKSRLGWQ